VYTEIPSEEEPDPAAGYVDLGLSVMWASCNLGASSPYEVGTKHSWVGGDGTGMSETTSLSYDPVYLSST
jgi:hypothetical protein